MKHHFLHYMDQVIQNRWNEVAFADYGEKKQYTHGEVAQQVERFHHLFRQMGIKEGDKIEVKLIGVDPKTNKYKLSHKAIMPKPEGWVERERKPRGEGRPRPEKGERKERHDNKK